MTSHSEKFRKFQGKSKDPRRGARSLCHRNGSDAKALRNSKRSEEKKMKTWIARTVLPLLVLVGCVQTIVSAQSVSAPHLSARHYRIVGLRNVQVTNFNCSTGASLASFRGLHKYELEGTAQVVPSTNPALLSAHMGIWRHVQKNDYQLAFKMFRFDEAGNNTGWVIVRSDIVIDEAATAYAGSGKAEVFDSNGNSLGTTCPAFTGTRFQ
jgi:hypothetical protein